MSSFTFLRPAGCVFGIENGGRDSDASRANPIRLLLPIPPPPGHVDAGKSTLMGRLLYELGVLSEKEKIANERGSEKMGKSSFQYAWALDGTIEERER